MITVEERVSTYESRRLEFADRLVGLRTVADLQAKDVAAALGWDATKVSKIERGRQTPSDADLTAYLNAVGAASDVVERMRHDLRELRITHAAWRHQLRTGQRARQEQDAREESVATVLRAVDVMAVPGLLQIAEYARAVLTTQTELLDVPAGDVDAAVRARLLRQRILYEPGRQIEILVAEAALATAVCSPAVMAAQLDRLVSAIGLPEVRFGVLPQYHRYPNLLPVGYWIVDDEVYVEHVSGELRVDEDDQVAVYNRLTDRLWQVAVEGDAARAIITHCRDRWAQAAMS